jgi:hypothetical protein
MLAKGVKILILDPNPTSLSTIMFALKSFKIDDEPVRVYTARNVSESIALIKSTFTIRQGSCVLAVILISLTEENASAGIELCRRFREELNHRETQIYFCVNHLGLVPERAVFDRYAINGYCAMDEMATDKLYSLVTTAVRHYRTLITNRIMLGLLEVLVSAGTQPTITYILNQVIMSLGTDSSGKAHDFSDPRVAFIFDGQVVAKYPALDDVEIIARWRALHALPGVALNGVEDKYVIDDTYMLIYIAPGPGRAELAYLCPLTGEIPGPVAFKDYPYFRIIATIWQQAAHRP